MKKLFKITSLVMALIFVFCACSSGNETTSDLDSSFEDVSFNTVTIPNNSGEQAKKYSGNNFVKFTMENGSSFIIELYPQYAPETVNNFRKLVSSGFYDGLTFHRIVEGFMAQGGSSDGLGYEGSEENIIGEFLLNGFSQNTLSHTRGVVSMARTDDYDSASSQFFICYDDASFLDGQYAAFGMVVEGMEVIDAFLDVERRYNSGGELASPVEPIIIKTAEVF